ncbi:MAG: HPP family protein [Phyllobacterium sp.]
MLKLPSFLRQFVPLIAPVSGMERARACAGALIGVLLTGLISRLALGPDANLPLLIAPMGASAVLLFATPTSPLAQPWSIVGGNVCAALIGITCATIISDPVAASAVAVAFTIAGMMALGCLHPPGGAVALTAVLGGPVVQEAGYAFAIWPVGLNSILLLSTALFFNNLTGRRYPHLARSQTPNPHRTDDRVPTERIGFVPEDLQAVLAQYDEIVDISPDELDALLHQVQMRAYARRTGEVTCAEIMSRDVATVHPQTRLQDAWNLLLKHKIKALPVVSEDGYLQGIITQTDFMNASALGVDGKLHFGFRVGFRQKFGFSAGARQRVESIMTREVQSALPETMIAKLVPFMADRGLHHVPVVDHDNRVVGVVTQTDLIAALFEAKQERAHQAANEEATAGVRAA